MVKTVSECIPRPQSYVAYVEEIGEPGDEAKVLSDGILLATKPDSTTSVPVCGPLYSMRMYIILYYWWFNCGNNYINCEWRVFLEIKVYEYVSNHDR